jgi:hypothetical protein
LLVTEPVKDAVRIRIEGRTRGMRTVEKATEMAAMITAMGTRAAVVALCQGIGVKGLVSTAENTR